MDTTTLQSPLGDITEQHEKSLYATLWNWESCAICAASKSTTCSTLGCPTQRIKRLGPFKDFYRLTTARYLPEFAASPEIALRGHDDLIEIIQHVKKNLGTPRKQLMTEYFTSRAKREGHQELPNWHDQERAFNMGVRVLTMVNCSAENQAGAFLEEGLQPIAWANKDSLASFINKSFPTTDHPSLNDPSQAGKGINLKSSLEGRRLVKVAGLSFRGTDNLAHHLRLDADNGCVEVFHHTRALKEYLIASRDQESAASGHASSVE